MLYNYKNIGVGKVNAYFNHCIEIVSRDCDKKLYLNFNREKHNFKDTCINEKIDLIKHLYWDTTLQTEETYYVFDITKDKVCLTKLDDNKFRIEVDVNNPDMIYCPLGKKKHSII